MDNTKRIYYNIVDGVLIHGLATNKFKVLGW